MSLHCPRCERKLADSADPSEPPLFCMFCGQKLRSGDLDQTLPPVVMPDPPSMEIENEMSTRTAASPTSTTSVETETAPSRVAGFRLLRFLGAGGMGSVYEAEADHTGQKVAVKLLARRLASNPASVERFRQEGRLASQISHPRCVFVLRADTDNGRPFIVMELMPGKTLKDVVDESGPMSVEVAVGHILDVIDGLIEAHRLGVIHRDVKPSNCFLTEDGRVKVGDFGLSKSLGPDAPNPKQLTGSGAFLGTVLFASPEQIRGEAVGYDSDVYAVSATLYYLLTGRAPHQHDSLTAALARAISEAPPSLREKRNDIPMELDRAVLKGLDRDRTRRYQVLEELRDALVAVLPARQIPARPRALFLAYLIDTLLLQLAIIPAEVIHQATLHPDSVRVSLFAPSLISLSVTFFYFLFLEGRLGATLGKRAMRLRVVRLGQTGPPGLWPATLRTMVYNSVWFFMFVLPGVLIAVGGWFAGLSGLSFLLIGLAVLLRQLWRADHGYRGVHDFASGTRTVQLPRPPARLRLVSHVPNPLDQQLSVDRAAPELVGGFHISGLICHHGEGGELWMGEDRSLGRRVLIRVDRAGSIGYDFDDLPEPRAHRLRIVGYGIANWGAERRPWIAYVAPAGAPLPDVVSPTAPLGWAEARPVLDQLVAELVAAEADIEARPITPEQVWVEPNGRVQVLDFPLPTGRELAEDRTKSRYSQSVSAPMDSIRAVATLLLEGQARTTGGRIAAPLPPHASAITDRLMTDGRDGYRKLSTLARDLAENHTLPPQITSGLRAAHLTVQAPLVALGLLMMFLLAGCYSFFLALAALETARLPNRVKVALSDPTRRAQTRSAVLANTDLPPRTRNALIRSLDELQWPTTAQQLRDWGTELHKSMETDLFLNDPERKLLAGLHFDDPDTSDLPHPRAIYFALTSVEGGNAPDFHQMNPREQERIWQVVLLVLTFPVLIWPLFATIFRGGLSMLITGIAVVTADGLPASRWRCALREFLGWMPLTAVLLVTLWLQHAVPQYVFVRTFLWLLAVVMLPLSIAIAIRTPNRGPHDRIMRTFLVPR